MSSGKLVLYSVINTQTGMEHVTKTHKNVIYPSIIDNWWDLGCETHWMEPMNHNCSNAPRYIALKGGLCGLTLFCRCISLCFEIKLQRHQKTSIIMTYNIFSSYLIGCGFTTTGINLTWHPIFVLYIFISSTQTVFFIYYCT